MKWLFIILLLNSIILSCGSDDSSSSQEKVINYIESEEPMKDGEYVAYLRTINSSVNGYIPFGRAELSLKEDEFKIVTYLDDDQGVMHMQRIHTASKCPTLSDDINKDGYIDIIEAQTVLGEVILPLDNDLTSRATGEDLYPKGPSFTYARSAKWSTILNDLKEEYRDGYFVLQKDYLNFENKVILVHGTANTSLIPSTLETIGGMPSHLSIPIACGIIKPI